MNIYMHMMKKKENKLKIPNNVLRERFKSEQNKTRKNV